MRVLNVSERIEGKFEGKFADETDFHTLLNEDAIVYKPDGELLCVVLKRAMDQKNVESAWEAIGDGYNPVSRNRGIASGEERKTYIKGDGTASNTHIAAPVGSGIIGFFERNPRMPFCRACSWNLENPDKWAKLFPMVRQADALLAQHAPKRYAKQKRVSERAHSDFIIAGTCFSTLTVNKNFRTAYHRDAGNIADGISAMSIITKGKWSGAKLVMPEFGVAVQLEHNDLIIFDPHEIHGNTRLVKLSKDAVRCSVVYYFREKIQECLSAPEELERVKNRKQGEQLHTTILRKKED